MKQPLDLKLKLCAEKIDSFICKLLEPKRPNELYQAASHILTAGGKHLRPYLVVKSCELMGGNTEAAIPFAAALEMLHNFTLIHDDIMDNDELRRGVKTVHTQWGLPIGIASGDLLFAKAYEAIISYSDTDTLSLKRIIACVERLTKSAIAICEGQVLDISLPHLRDVSEEDYFLMIGEKTAALFKACAEIGAIVGGGNQEEVEMLGSYAWYAGIAFQLVDDYLGATSDVSTLGKPVGSDFREGKKTLIIIHALENASQDKRKTIERILGEENPSPDDIAEAISVIKGLGSLKYTLKYAKKYSERAKNILESFPESEAKLDLMEIIDYFINRTY